MEAGKDVFVLMDSITRVARAYNSVHGGSGRTMSGGVDAGLFKSPKDVYGSKNRRRRLFDHSGNGLVDTGSRMDELIFRNSREPVTWN